MGLRVFIILVAVSGLTCCGLSHKKDVPDVPDETFQIKYTSTIEECLALGTLSTDIVNNSGQFEMGRWSTDYLTVKVGTYSFYKKHLIDDLNWNDITANVGGIANNLPYTFEKNKKYMLSQGGVQWALSLIP
jgi:hypothetical protein